MHHLRPSTSGKHEPSRQEIQDYLYLAGVTKMVPTNEPDTQEEATMRKYLADLFGQGKSVSDMVIEDRGPAPTFISSDTELLTIAQLEGLDIGNPSSELSI